MDLDGKKVRIIEDPSGWFGPTLVGETGIAVFSRNQSAPHSSFYHLTDSDEVFEHLLFHSSRLEEVSP